MRRLHLGPDGKIPSSTFSRLAANSPEGVLCSRLEVLRWDVEDIPGALPFFRLFIPPDLKLVSLYGPCTFDIPGVWLAGLVQIISILPTSLEGLAVMYGRGKEERLRDAVSAFICRCRPSLRVLRSCVPLSGAAIRRITQLPNLRSWAVAQPPPPSIPPSPFPPLERLRFVGHEALPWLHLLASHEDGTVQNGTAPVTPYTHVKESLRSLICREATIINSAFLSSVLKFRNLAVLYVGTRCPTGGCTFHLTDDNVEKLVAGLPRLESLQLGIPCSLNSCNTTAASLLSISTHCPELTVLETHFNTITIVANMRRLLDGGSGYDGAKCKVRNLMIARLPHEIDREYVEIVMRGFRTIFPCLMNLTDSDGRWYEVSSILHEVDGDTFGVGPGMFGLFPLGQLRVTGAEDL